MKTTLCLVSTLLIPLLLINLCLYSLAPVPAYAGEEKITRFEPESAESQPIADEDDKLKKTRLVPWAISAAVLTFIVVGFLGIQSQSDSGSSSGSIDVGW